ncbi:MAG: MBL fold metallo-hydrolase [Bryobacteraceae bacterium]|nr:MBL fold metallo-hydrolase [Bryobacteraceae bacterium]
MRFVLTAVAAFALAIAANAASTLDIYFVDVEGGQATLIVSPSGESMLVDAGWPGYDGRDANRIAAAARKAGLKQIDYMLVTHYHLDHVGGVPPLAEMFPIVHFVDHGPNTETGPQADKLAAPYYAAREKGKHIVVRPGDAIPIKGIKVDVVSARGDLLSKALSKGKGRNALCNGERKRDDASENGKSIGVVVTYDNFRFVDLGDLTWNIELGLACPDDKLGPVDVYLTTHHGMDLSGPPALVHALRPRVAVMNNGEKKGGSPAAWQVVKDSPGLEGFWQLHYSLPGGNDHNVEEKYIANMSAENCGHGIKISAQKSGAFTVTNERTGHQETYKR